MYQPDDDVIDPTVDFVRYDDRELILSKMYESIEWLHSKANNGRITKNDIPLVKTRVLVFKTLAYMCSVYSQVKKDVEIEELSKKVENLLDEVKTLKGESIHD